MPSSSPSRPSLGSVLVFSAALLGCQAGPRPSAVDEPSPGPVPASEARTTRAPGHLPAVPPPMAPAPVATYEVAAEVALPDAAPEDHPQLHNLFRLSGNVVSGGEPDGEDAFRRLRDEGIRTILSVDGKVPDAELAAQYGMRYVHVPIQYKGITDGQIARIAKTFRELEGPFYVHCFHGKHRGPAAAELGRLVLDGISRERALAEMRQWCGTSSSYEGLYATVAYAELPSERETEDLDWDFPASEPLSGVAGAMVPIARSSDHLKAASRNGWQPPADHPDLSARNEATMIADLFERTLALEEVVEHPADFQGWMRDAALRSAALREAVHALESGGTAEAADRALKELTSTCTACHEVYRN